MTKAEPRYPELQNQTPSDATYRAIIAALLDIANVPSIRFTAEFLRAKRISDNQLVIVTDPHGNYILDRR